MKPREAPRKRKGQYGKASKPGRGRGVDATGRSKGDSRFVMLPHWLLNSPAWRTLNCVARALYIELESKFNGVNNGKIVLGVRSAAVALHVKPDTASRAFNLLMDLGFIKLARDSSFNLKTRQAREWTLTRNPTGAGDGTKDFMRWRPGPNSKHGPETAYEQSRIGIQDRVRNGQSIPKEVTDRGS